MLLSDELISQLVKVTNDRQKDTGNTVVYGTIRDDGGRKYVQIDGSDAFAPVETTVEIAPGDRVSVSVRNHTATVTGNISDPAIGTKTADGLRSSITQTAAEIRMELSDEVNKLNSSLVLTAQEIRSELSNEVSGLHSSISQTADSITSLVKQGEEFSKFQQTVEGFSFMGKGGTVKISGGDIILTGAIKFEDLSQEVVNEIEEIDNIANNALLTAGDALGIANEAIVIARSNSIPNYIKSTYIDATTIKSPTIEGNDIKVYGTFQTIGLQDGTQVATGYMGAATGMASDGQTTYGVALSNTWNEDDFSVGTSYVIVTNAGVRLQFGQNRVVVTQGGIYLSAEDALPDGTPARAYYNGKELGTGGVPVWG